MTGITAALASPFPSFSIMISDRTIAHLDTGGAGYSEATLTIKNDGTVRNHDNVLLETWLASGLASNWDVRATLSSGNTPSGTLGSWLNCGTSRSWTLVDSSTADGVKSCVLLIELRSGGVIADSANITLQAQAT